MSPGIENQTNHDQATTRKYLWVISVLVWLFLQVGCSRNVAKVHIQQAGEVQIQFNHRGGEIEFWTDLDIEYKDLVEMLYEIAFFQQDELVIQVLCGPFDVVESQMMRKVDLQDRVKVSYLGKMNCKANIPPGQTNGLISFIAQGDEVYILRADLILK